MSELRNFILNKLAECERDTTRLVEYLDSTDYFTAPASTRYHGAYEGGLAEHCVNVLDMMLSINDMFENVYKLESDSRESIIIVALLHDLCKVNCYKQKQCWRKDANGKWEGYIGYVRDPELPMGHAGKSVFLAQKYVELTEKEAQAIYWHMGAYDKSEYNNFTEMGNAFEGNSLAFKLHMADMSATYVLENPKSIWVE